MKLKGLDRRFFHRRIETFDQFANEGILLQRRHRVLASGLRLATLVAGMTVGEMALLETHRSADVWADTRVECLELSLDDYARFRERHPRASERIVHNLAALLARKLIVANRKIDALASY